MTIELSKLMKDLNLTDEQMKSFESVQTTISSAYENDFETQRSSMDNKNKELLDKLAKAKEDRVPEGFDIDGYKNYIDNKEEIEKDKKKIEDDKLIATQNWDKLKNEMNNSHEKTLRTETKKLNKEIDSLRKTLDSELIENVALKEIDAVDGSQTLLMPHIKSSIATFKEETTGRYITKVVDSLGQDRINSKTGDAMTVKELVSEFQANELFSGAFPIQNQGSNTNVNAGGGTHNATNNPFDKKGKNYSLTEQAKLRKTNPTLAKSLSEAV